MGFIDEIKPGMENLVTLSHFIFLLGFVLRIKEIQNLPVVTGAPFSDLPNILPKKDILCVCVILFYLQNTVGYQYM
jgi:hypothetical protein